MNLRLWPIVTALAIGLAAGAFAHGTVNPDGTIVASLRLVGTLWLNALRLTLLPLIFGLVVTGVAKAASAQVGGKLGLRIAMAFTVLLLLSALVGAIAGSLLLDLGPLPAIANAAPSEGVKVPGADAWLLGLVPPNLVSAAADDAIVPIVLFALAFAIAAVRLKERAEPVLRFFEALADVMILLVQWVLLLAPVGIFALAFVLGATTGLGAGAFLGWYVLVQIIVTLLLAALIYPLIIGRRGSAVRFARAALAPQAVALSTQSSLASLPAMVSAARQLGLSEQGSGIVLPLAVALFRIAAPASIVIVTLALARIAGIELGLPQLALVLLLATINTLVIAGLPNQITFFAAYAPPALAVGIPIELLPLFLAIDAIPDMFYTVANVTADLGVATLIDGRARAATEA